MARHDPRKKRPKPRRRGARRGKPPKPRWRRWLGRLAALLVLLGVAGIAGIAGVFWYYGRDLPEVDQLRSYEPPQTTRVLDRNGALLGEIFVERRTVVPMERIPRVLVLSVLAAEDADFYQHEGLDYPGIVRAVVRDLVEGRAAQGASTITQQVVKLLLLSPERTFRRKIRELILARRVEQELTKDEILYLYLNHINFGHGRYGAQEAAQYYFGKDVEDLSLAEASLIAGVPQAPARLSPRSHPEAARRRQRYVLSQLEAKREQYWPDLTLDEIRAARDAEVPLAEPEEERGGAPELMRIARRELRRQVGEEAYRRGGFTVHTTVDLELQRQAREALQKGLRAIDRRHRYSGPLRPPRRQRRRRREPEQVAIETLREGRIYVGYVTGADDEGGTIVLDVGGHRVVANARSAARYNPDDLPPSELAPIGARAHVSITHLEEDGSARGRLELGPQGAVVVIDPRTRDVLALVGGYDAKPGFDRATQAVRQPGSTFKPIVYALGIRERRLTPATVMIDAPAVYDRWRPRNYETWRHEGPVRLRVALAKSINLVAVRAMEDLGPENVVAFARELGIESELEPSLSLALGSSGVRPIEMANAYATFAAGGRWAPPRFISRIAAPDGSSTDVPAPASPRQVMTPAEAYVVTDLLTSVTSEGGTAARAARLGRPSAGKTGTSNNARDAWFVGFTPDTVAAVWVGFDDRRSLGRRESGGRSALPIWMDVVRAADRDRPVVDFPRPSGVVTARIDPATGLLAYDGQEDAIDEIFLEGTVPQEHARPPEIADPSTFLMEQLGGTAAEDDEDQPVDEP